ncbi:Ribokinase-like protein, partial [Anaeromyces robustus]
KKIIPPLTHELHKGQSGRIAVIGGSEEYTGAPFFSAMSSLKLGTDLAHIFCEKKAAIPIKSYSPELIVHPYLQNLEHLKKHNAQQVDIDAKIDEIVERVSSIFPRLHVLVIGPGLSRDQGLITTVEKIIEKAKAVNLPLVIDADGLWIIQNNPDLIKGYKPAILTPNVVEFNRLC